MNIKYNWIKISLPISIIFSFRMFGLFMLFPIFTVLSSKLKYANHTLIGIAFGIYGLTQGIMQIPMGILSDYYNRKIILTINLFCFSIGSLIAALSNSIYTMIFARSLQGFGAIGSILVALLSDLVLEEEITKSMLIIGINIGITFNIAIIISPIITYYFQLKSIFYISTILPIIGIILLHISVPNPNKKIFYLTKNQTFLHILNTVIKNKNLQKLNLSIFIHHFILTTTFYALPIILKNLYLFKEKQNEQWIFYFKLIILTSIITIPIIFFTEKNKLTKKTILYSVIIIEISQIFLTFLNQYSYSLLFLLTLIYFISFNILEANLPSLISKQAYPSTKGTAIGIYSSSQFLGIFIGGLFSGILDSNIGIIGIFITNACISLIWIIICFYIEPNIRLLILPIKFLNFYKKNNKYTNNNCIIISNKNKVKFFKKINKIPGIKKISLSKKEKKLYIYINNNQIKKNILYKLTICNLFIIKKN
ncbi:MFS transporter [Candidatus Legionella polyplacis]|uniref:MFS transporter n=1 Tax=Candidatus Legionella polyplacis TaxID=2005262 RepID=A0ABZ2H0H2_9GAMM